MTTDPFVFNHRHLYAECELPNVHPHARAIRDLVLRECSIDISTLVGTCRHPAATGARMIAVRLLRRHTLLSYPEIARAITPGRGHSSVITMDQRLERLPVPSATLELLERIAPMVPAALGRAGIVHTAPVVQ